MRCDEKIATEHDGTLLVRVTNQKGSYCLWRTELGVGDHTPVYFEMDSQANGGYDVVRECTVGQDGIHIVLCNGDLQHFYFPKYFDKYDDLKSALK